MNQQMYNTKELQEMSADELRVAQANGFVKPEGEKPYIVTLPENVQPAPAAPSQDPYAPTSWGTPYFDFVAPSGQRCQMQKMRPEELIEKGMLDKLTRLPAFAQENIDKAEGKPPTKNELPDAEATKELLAILEDLIPLVVVQPKVLPTPKPEADGAVKARVPGVVYVSDIELADRVAIMERSVQGVVKLDNFRQEP